VARASDYVLKPQGWRRGHGVVPAPGAVPHLRARARHRPQAGVPSRGQGPQCARTRLEILRAGPRARARPVPSVLVFRASTGGHARSRPRSATAERLPLRRRSARARQDGGVLRQQPRRQHRMRVALAETAARSAGRVGGARRRAPDDRERGAPCASGSARPEQNGCRRPWTRCSARPRASSAPARWRSYSPAWGGRTRGLASCTPQGRVPVQDEASTVQGMPGASARAGLAHAVVPLAGIGGSAGGRARPREVAFGRRPAAAPGPSPRRDDERPARADAQRSHADHEFLLLHQPPGSTWIGRDSRFAEMRLGASRRPRLRFAPRRVDALRTESTGACCRLVVEALAISETSWFRDARSGALRETLLPGAARAPARNPDAQPGSAAQAARPYSLAMLLPSWRPARRLAVSFRDRLAGSSSARAPAATARWR
jgi:hypothetical protein